MRDVIMRDDLHTIAADDDDDVRRWTRKLLQIDFGIFRITRVCVSALVLQCELRAQCFFYRCWSFSFRKRNTNDI